MTAPGGGNVIGTAFVQVVPLVRDFTNQLQQQLQRLRQEQAQQLQRLRQQQAAQRQQLQQLQTQQTQQLRQQQAQLLTQLRRLSQISRQQLQQVQTQQFQQLQQLRTQQLQQLQGLRDTQLQQLQGLQRQNLQQLQRIQTLGQQQLQRLRDNERQAREQTRAFEVLQRGELRAQERFFLRIRHALQATSRDLRRIQREINAVSRTFRFLTAAVNGLSVALPLASAGLRTLGVLAITGNLLALAGALTDLTGVVALLPAGFVLAGAAAGTLVVGLFGVKDAIDAFLAGDTAKFNAALKELSKNARETLKVLNEFKPQLKAFKDAVQDALFVGLADVARQLGRELLPRVQKTFVGIAESLNLAVRNLAKFLLQADTLRDVDTISGNVVRSFKNLSPAVVNVAAGLRDLTTVGSKFLPGIAAEAAVLTGVFRNFIAQSRASGALDQFILRGIDAARDLLKILFNVSQVFVAISRAAREAGVGFLKTLEGATRSLADFTKSARGQSALTEFFVQAKIAAAALLPVLGEVVSLLFVDLLPILVDFGKIVAPAAIILVNALSEALKLAAPGIHDLAQGFAEFIVELTPALPAIGRLAGALATLLGTIFERLGPPLAQLIIAVAEGLIPVVEGLTRLISGLTTEQLKWIIVIGAVIIAIGPFVSALRGVFTLISLLAGAISFFLTPVGLIVVGVAALAGALIFAWRNSETFRNVIKTLLKTLEPLFDVIKQVWQEIKGPLKDAFEAIKPLLKPLAIGFGFVLIGLIVLFTGLAVIIFGLIKILEGFIKLIDVAFVKPIGAIVNFAKNVGTGVTTVIDNVADFLGIVEKRTGFAVGSISQKLGELGSATGEAGAAVTRFGVVTSGVFTETSATAKKSFEEMTNELFGLNEPLGQAGQAALNFESTTGGAFGRAVAAVKDGIQNIHDALNGAAEPAGRAGSTLGLEFSAGTGRGLAAAKDAAFGAMGEVRAALGDNGGFFSSGSAIGDEFARGILSRIGDVRRAALEAMRAASGPLPRSPAKEGPFSGRGWAPFRGRALVEGFAEGIQDGLAALRSSSLQVVGVTATGLSVPPLAGFGSRFTESGETERSNTVVNTQVRVFIDGRELRDVAVEVVDERDRQLLRSVRAGAGGAL